MTTLRTGAESTILAVVTSTAFAVFLAANVAGSVLILLQKSQAAKQTVQQEHRASGASFESLLGLYTGVVATALSTPVNPCQ